MKSTTEKYAELKGQIARYVFGIRGKRENPVSLRQIQQYFYPADPRLISSSINDLLTDGLIDIRRNSPRSGHSHRQGFSYVPVDSCPMPDTSAADTLWGYPIIINKDMDTPGPITLGSDILKCR